jgi:hypothetical protein
MLHIDFTRAPQGGRNSNCLITYPTNIDMHKAEKSGISRHGGDRAGQWPWMVGQWIVVVV